VSTLIRRFSLAMAGLMLFSATTHAALISDGLVLNFQADNIDGQNNATLTAGQEVVEWVDVVAPGGHVNANNATVQGAVDYLVAGQGTPNYELGVVPGVRFSRTGGNAGDALGFNTAVNGLVTNNAFTAFVVGDFGPPGPARIMQFGFRNAGNHRIVGLANTGYRFNGGSQIFDEDQFDPGASVATYAMDLTQNYSTAEYRLDGMDGTSPNTSNDQMLNLTNFNQGFVIGGGKNNSQTFIDPLNGLLNALVVYNRVLSDAEVLEVEEFLAGKFLIPEPSSALLLMAACGALVSKQRRSA
jgi:hypothetical protein